jgi:hypothetical protein
LATTSATESATSTATTTTTTSASNGPKLSVVTGERLVRSLRAKELVEVQKKDDETEAATTELTMPKPKSEVDQVMERILSKIMSHGDKQDNQIDKMADIMRTMTDTIKSMKESYRTLSESYLKLQQRVDKQESEVKGVKMSLDNDIKEIKINVDKADSSEIFKELAWREERSKELILFKIDESDSNSWNETKTYERTELTKTINKVCDFNESEVVFIRRVGVKTPNKVRPIVVGLKSMSRRDDIVARGRRARVGIDENLTPNQLENKRRVKDEVKLRNEDGHLYKMVGSAGNYKSVRVKTKQ